MPTNNSPWSAEPPSEAGWWWMRWYGGKPRVVEVTKSRDGGQLWVQGLPSLTKIEDLVCEWYQVGPLQPPDGGEG